MIAINGYVAANDMSQAIRQSIELYSSNDDFLGAQPMVL